MYYDIQFNFIDTYSMEGYYYGILRKYTEELKIKQMLKEQVPSTASLSSLESYHQTKPFVYNQTNSITSYNTMYNHI